jgi:hypothetical protein
MRLFVTIAILLITAGVASMLQVGGAETGAAAYTTQAATSLPQVLGVLAIAGGVAFLVGSRQRTT